MTVKVKLDNIFGKKTGIFENCIDAKVLKDGIATYEIADHLFDRLMCICKRYNISYSVVQEETTAEVKEEEAQEETTAEPEAATTSNNKKNTKKQKEETTAEVKEEENGK